MFNKVKAAVLTLFGIASFAKDEQGRSVLTADQKKKLTEEWGEKFANKFLENLREDEEKPPSLESQAEVEAERKKLTTLQSEFEKYKATSEKERKELSGKIKKLSATPEVDPPAESLETMEKPPFKVDMSLMHNQALQNYALGDGSKMSVGNSIDTNELKTEFGKYIHSEKLAILRRLTQRVESVKYMTTVLTDKDEWRAVSGEMNSVVQGFSNKWTPLGKSKFKPLSIPHRHHKINVPIVPSQVLGSVLACYYDEGLAPKDMPVVRYIIERMLLPQVDEDREMLLLATGVYEEVSNPTTGSPGQATGKSMDGYCTILKNQKALKDANDPKAEAFNFLLDGVTLTPDNIVEKMEEAADNITREYKHKSMTIHADPDLVSMYNRAYREKYPATKNEDGQRRKIDFTNLTFGALPGMTKSGMFFITPKTNFIHLLSKNKDASKMFMQTLDYEVKVFAEWKESVGFAHAEEVWAYIPPAESQEGA